MLSGNSISEHLENKIEFIEDSSSRYEKWRIYEDGCEYKPGGFISLKAEGLSYHGKLESKNEEIITDKKEFSYAIKGFQKAWTGGKEWSNSISEKKLSQSFLFSR